MMIASVRYIALGRVRKRTFWITMTPTEPPQVLVIAERLALAQIVGPAIKTAGGPITWPPHGQRPRVNRWGVARFL